MAELILIPCSGSKNPFNTNPVIPAGAPNIIATFAQPDQAMLIAKRAALTLFAAPVAGYSVAHFRYNGPHAWQYNFPQALWIARANPLVHVLIVSAYYGLLIPYSYIQNYNLKMSDPIATPDFNGTVQEFWTQNHFLHNLLINYCQENNITDIHNLLTHNYQEAIELGTPIPGVAIPPHDWADNYGHARGAWLAANL